MKSKYRTGDRVEVNDVRAELYHLRKTILAWKSEHIVAWGTEHDEKTCRPCRAWEGEIRGVERAIRTFGGQPR